MWETPEDRTQIAGAHAHPLVDEALAPASSLNPSANAINGHESVNVRSGILQVACTFPLATPRLCQQASFDAERGCRCYEGDGLYNNAACQPPGGGQPGTTQYLDYAYPGTRHLQLLKALGDNAVTASICPKITDPDQADYGYRPAMKALAARLERAFNP
jgi:hypothetical protein